jgi:thioredoxin-related protein
LHPAATWAIVGFVIALFITLVMVFINLQEKSVGYWEKPKLAQPPQLLPQATPPTAKFPEPKPAVDVVKTAPETLVWRGITEGLTESQATDKALLYFFTDGKSDLCQKIEQEFFGDGEVAARINRSFVPVKVTDEVKVKSENSPEVMSLENRFQVTAFPILVVQVPGRKGYKKMISYTDAPSAMDFLNKAIR